MFQLLVWLCVMLNIAAYEQHLYSGYSDIIKVVSVFGLIFAAFIRRMSAIPGEVRSSALVILVLLLVLVNCASVLIGYVSAYPGRSGYLDIIKVVLNYAWLLAAVYLFDTKAIEMVLEVFMRIGVLLALVNVCIMLFNGFLIWDKVYIVRGASVFYDPNYFGAYNMFALLYYYASRYSRWRVSWSVVLVLVASLFLSFSKSSFLIFVLSIWLYLLITSRWPFKVSLVAMGVVIPSALYLVLTSFEYFRLEMGLNNRGNMFHYFMSKINESPLIGFGVSNISDMLESAGLANASFHSYLLDNVFAYGVVSGVILLLIFLYVLVCLLKKDAGMMVVFLALFLNSFFISYSFGGFGALSVLLTLFLAYAANGCRVKTRSNCSGW